MDLLSWRRVLHPTVSAILDDNLIALSSCKGMSADSTRSRQMADACDVHLKEDCSALCHRAPARSRAVDIQLGSFQI